MIKNQMLIQWYTDNEYKSNYVEFLILRYIYTFTTTRAETQISGENRLKIFKFQSCEQLNSVSNENTNVATTLLYISKKCICCWYRSPSESNIQDLITMLEAKTKPNLWQRFDHLHSEYSSSIVIILEDFNVHNAAAKMVMIVINELSLLK